MRHFKSRTAESIPFITVLVFLSLITAFASSARGASAPGGWDPGIGPDSVTPAGDYLMRDGNDNWWGGFGDPNSSPGTNGTVYAVIAYQGRLIVGGSFSTAGGVYVSNIAQWDGAAWVGLGNGLNSNVYALAVYGDRLIAAGEFTQSGSLTVSRIAQWDGVTWSPLSTGMDGAVQALGIYDGTLVAGGSFIQAGGQSASRIARWNGSSWSALGSGVNNTVYAISTYGGALIVGGNFDQAGSVSASRVALWNGTDWYRMSTGLNGTVYSLYQYGGELIAGGQFSSYIAKWNGAIWSVFGGGADSYVFALGSYDGDLIAGGYFGWIGGVNAGRVAKWNGSGWSALGSGVSNAILSTTQVGTHLLVGGDFTQAGGQSAYYVARWDGAAWSGLASRGLSGACHSLHTADGLAYLGGNFTTAGGLTAYRTARWNGAAFASMGSGTDGLVTSLASLGTDVYAGGTFTSAGGSTALSIAKWNGSTWSAVGGGMNHNVRALATWSNSIIAGGEFTQAGATAANRIARWDGSAWSALGSGVNAPVYAIAPFGSSLAVGGSFTQAGGQTASYVALWNGSTWLSLPGLNGVVRALHVHDGSLVAGGDFTDGANLRYIARWGGTAWEPFGSGFNAPVLALTTYDGQLVAGGAFTQAGGQAVNCIAAWDGTSWLALGSGVNNTVRALSVFDTVLLVGGDFTTAGGKPSYNIARWTASTAADLQVADIQWSPTIPFPNVPVQVRALIRNTGSVTAGASTARITVDGSLSCDLPVGTVYGSQDAWTDWCSVGSFAEGTHSIEACADVLTEVEEAFEDNNCREEQFSIVVPDAYYIPEGLEFHAGDREVEIPIHLRNTNEFYRYEVRVAFDPAVLSYYSYSLNGTRALSANNWGYNWDEGWIRFYVDYRWSCPGIPSGDGPILKLIFNVKETAPGGLSPIQFVDSGGYYNRIRLCDNSYQTPALLGGTINITPLEPYRITSISDVGNDQGRQVRIRWNREWNDAPYADTTIVSYSIYRRIDGDRIAPPRIPTQQAEDGPLRYPPGDWDFLRTVPASGEDSYAAICETLCDSTITEGMCWSTFFVRANGYNPWIYFDTPPDSGFSVDNLAPSIPRDLHVEGDNLVWDASEEEDFAYYSVYESADDEFDPQVDALIGYTMEPNYDISGIEGPFVVVAATDIAGNQGDGATLGLPSAAGEWLEGLKWSLKLVAPNPSRDAARISYAVPLAADVDFIVCDAGGRIIRRLASGCHERGRYEVIWRYEAAQGEPVASGVYFCRLRASGFSDVKKILLVR